MQSSEVKLGGGKISKAGSDKRPVRVIAVTGGKGGTGKTNIAVNLALAMANMGHRTMLLDADLGMANVDVLLGLKAQATLLDVLSGQCSLEDIIIDGPDNLMVIPAASGIKQLANIGLNECIGLVRAFSDLNETVDNLVIDTATGISEVVTSFCSAATEVIVVVCNEPASFRDSAAQIQMLSAEYGVTRFRILASMVRTESESQEVFRRMQEMVSADQNIICSSAGFIPFDDQLRKAVSLHQAVIDVFPECRASVALKNLARHVSAWPRSSHASGHLEFFVERLFKNEDIIMEVLS